MSRVTKSRGARDHDTAVELLPWYLNGTLEGPELEAVEHHLRACPECAAELEEQGHLAHLLRTSDELAFSAARGLDRLRDRLGDEDEASDPRVGPQGTFAGWRRSFGDLGKAARWALAAQAAAIVLLVGALLAPGAGDGGAAGGASDASARADFRTLTEAPAAVPGEGPRLRVVFDDAAREGDVRRLLQAIGAGIVAGPSAFGVYTVQVGTGEIGGGEVGSDEVGGSAVGRDEADADAETALETLRSSELVVFVEPLR